MASLAQVAFEMGIKISGSDVDEEFITDKNLRKIKANIYNFDDKSFLKCDLVIFSAAHDGEKNAQVQTAIKNNIFTISYAKALAYFFQDKKIIAIAGTHGKTTTTAMLATILNFAQTDPSWIIGTGDIASIEWDHPDVFKTEKMYQNSFKKLIQKTFSQGIIVAPGENGYLRKRLKGYLGKVKYVFRGKFWHNLKLQIPGDFNLQNATFAANLAHAIGIDQQTILASLKQFKGLERRMEFKGELNGWKLYDDYAHHPSEIKTVLSAFRKLYPDGYICVAFQSHTFSRTKQFINEFAKSFKDADQVFVAPIFSSAREQHQYLDLKGEISKYHPNVHDVSTDDSLSDLLNKIKTEKKVKVFATIGAGDIYKIFNQ